MITIQIRGPQGCGKTRIADALKTLLLGWEVEFEEVQTETLDAEAEWSTKMAPLFERGSFTSIEALRALGFADTAANLRSLGVKLGAGGWERIRVRRPYSTESGLEWIRKAEAVEQARRQAHG